MHIFLSKAVKIAALSALATLLLSASALAAEDSGLAVSVGSTTGSSLRMREGSSTSSEIITLLDKNVTVAVLDDTLSGWYKIRYAGNTGYVSADYLSVSSGEAMECFGRTNGSNVNVRSAASTDSEVKATLAENTVVAINALADGWYKVTCRYGTEGYIRSDLLDLTRDSFETPVAEVPVSGSASSSAIVDLARQYKGVRYVWGGASPSGFDCSGYTLYIYKNFGYSLPHSAASQWLSGPGTQVWSIGALQPGDLVFFNDPSRSNGKACSHAGIYIGDGQMIHASSAKKGVIVSDITSGYYYRYFVGGRHV